MTDRLAWVCEHGRAQAHENLTEEGWRQCPGPTRTDDLSVLTRSLQTSIAIATMYGLETLDEAEATIHKTLETP